MSLTDTRNQNQDTFGRRRTEGEKLKFDYLSEINFTSSMFSKEEHAFLFSVEQENERYKQRGQASLFGDPNQNQDVENYGVATEYRLGIDDNVFLSASYRKDNNDEFKDRETLRFS